MNSSAKIHLIAVQADMRLSDYQSAEHFKAKVLALTRRAVEDLDDAPKLVAFPETIGFPLLLTTGDYGAVSKFSRVSEGVRYLLRQHWRNVLRAAWRWRVFGLEALYLSKALPAYLAYRDAFSEAAQTYGVTIVAGSHFLPHIEEEATRGVHIADKRVHNVAYGFAPTGRIINRSSKRYLNPGTESRAGLSRSNTLPHPFETPVGRVGVAICLDGFYSSIIEHLDGLGTCIVVQPSANHAPWDRPWPADHNLSEGEAWLEQGLRAQLQGRLHLRYGVNPMMVGDVWNLRPRGRSSLLTNTRFMDAETEGYRGVLALAQSDDQEEVVRAEVAIPS